MRGHLAKGKASGRVHPGRDGHTITADSTTGPNRGQPAFGLQKPARPCRSVVYTFRCRVPTQGRWVMPRVVHFEVHADDPERAAKFYRELFGWRVEKWSGPVDYWMI